MTLKSMIKRILVRHFLIEQFCRDCGRTVVAWRTSDEIWCKGSGNEPNALCLECFACRARKNGIFYFFVDIE